MQARIIRTVFWLIILAVTALGVKACAGSTSTPEPTAVAVLPPTTTPEPPLPTAVPPTDTAIPPTETPAPPTATPTEEPASPTPAASATATAEPEDTATPEPEDTPTPEPEAAADSDNCIGCHTSQETLQALAEDKTVKSEATSGEG
jgi:hypothetical protein